MTKTQEQLIVTTCADFRKIRRGNDTLAAIHILTDLFMISSIFWGVFDSSKLLAFLPIVIVVAKIVLTALKRDIASCAVQLVLSIMAFLLCVVFGANDYDTAAIFIVSCIIYALRFKKLCVISRISNMYGFPKFNAMLILSEIKDDETLSNRVAVQYETIKSDRVMSREMKRLSLAAPLRILGYAGIIAVVFGVVIGAKGFSDSSKIDSAVNLADFELLSDGSSVTGSISEIYCNSVVGLDKHASDGYWCKIGDKAVTVEATGYRREKFALLYNYLAEQNDTSKYEGIPEVEASSPDPVSFYGVVCEADEDDEIINRNVLEKNKVQNAVTDLYIKVINPETADKLIVTGVLLIVIGLITSLCVNIPVYLKNDN